MPLSESEDPLDPDYLPHLSSTQRILLSWKHGQHYLNEFWKIWRDQYLLNLRESHAKNRQRQGLKVENPPKIGDLVLVGEKSTSRVQRKRARIQKLNQGRDKRVRSAEILLPTGKRCIRPITLLYPLETSLVNSSFAVSPVISLDSTVPERSDTPSLSFTSVVLTSLDQKCSSRFSSTDPFVIVALSSYKNQSGRIMSVEEKGNAEPSQEKWGGTPKDFSPARSLQQLNIKTGQDSTLMEHDVGSPPPGPSTQRGSTMQRMGKSSNGVTKSKMKKPTITTDRLLEMVDERLKAFADQQLRPLLSSLATPSRNGPTQDTQRELHRFSTKLQVLLRVTRVTRNHQPTRFQSVVSTVITWDTSPPIVAVTRIKINPEVMEGRTDRTRPEQARPLSWRWTDRTKKEFVISNVCDMGLLWVLLLHRLLSILLGLFCCRAGMWRRKQEMSHFLLLSHHKGAQIRPGQSIKLLWSRTVAFQSSSSNKSCKLIYLRNCASFRETHL